MEEKLGCRQLSWFDEMRLIAKMIAWRRDGVSNAFFGWQKKLEVDQKKKGNIGLSADPRKESVQV